MAKGLISFELSGSTTKTRTFLQKLQSGDIYAGVESIAQRGVAALQAATPRDSGETAASWSYEIERNSAGLTIYWINTHTNGAVNIAVILQYGHGTGTGGYVAGRDYINGALQPVFDQIADDVWRRVTSA